MSNDASFLWGLSTAACAVACVVMHAGATGTTSLIVYSEDFSGGGDGGYALSGLWHVAPLSDCTPLQPGFGLYFGQDAPLCDFATGDEESGGAVSAGIDLSDCIAPITLRFDYRIGGEGDTNCMWDIARVVVSDNGFATSVVEAASAGCPASTTLTQDAGWLTAMVDLSAWAGCVIELSFSFDSGDPFSNDSFGYAVTNIEIEATKPAQGLYLEGIACQDDVDAVEPGHQVAVELWMRGVAAPGATGFQAFVEFDETLLGYRDDLSAYTPAPFSLHVLDFGGAPPFEINWAPGKLRVDGSASPFEAPASGDWQLATLVFDVLDECATTSLDFGGYPTIPAFFSELSVFGSPLSTKLVASGPLQLDDTAPVLTCPAGITVAAQVNVPICGFSDCCAIHGPGCSDPACEAVVCAADPFCCAVAWDTVCAGEASTLCGGNPCLGAIVTYAPTATDNCSPPNPPPTVVCTPPSGTLFLIGTTSVICTATDACGNVGTCTFDVTVTATNEVVVDVAIAVGSFTASGAVRCIHFQTDDCGAMVDESLLFLDDGAGHQATGPVVIEVPCGEWTSLCAKDEQHTKWDTVPLVRSGTSWLAAPQIVLLPGDNDNDGDVDINDVTWLVFTFGALAAADPCPFDFPGLGPRDADFSLNGAIFTEDYSLLTDQFLTATSCACSLPATGDPTTEFERRASLELHEIDPRIRDHVDLDHNGMFDAEDVLIFEMLRGLPDTLSSRMRGGTQRDGDRDRSPSPADDEHARPRPTRGGNRGG